jgi:hypothetical protein
MREHRDAVERVASTPAAFVQRESTTYWERAVACSSRRRLMSRSRSRPTPSPVRAHPARSLHAAHAALSGRFRGFICPHRIFALVLFTVHLFFPALAFHLLALLPLRGKLVQPVPSPCSRALGRSSPTCSTRRTVTGHRLAADVRPLRAQRLVRRPCILDEA